MYLYVMLLTSFFFVLFIRPHRITMHIRHTSEPCKNGSTDRDTIRGLRTRVGPRNHALDGDGPNHPWEEAIFEGKMGGPL